MNKDLGPLRILLIEAAEELRLSAGLAEQVDLHAAAARQKIVAARAEFDKLMIVVGEALGAQCK